MIDIKQLFVSIFKPREANEDSPPEADNTVGPQVGDFDPPASVPIWDYSIQYPIVVREGHTKRPPSFGSPTFVWHLGIWQKTQSDEIGQHYAREPLSDKYQNHDRHNEAFFKEINSFIVSLQQKGRVLIEKTSEDGERQYVDNIDEFRFTEVERVYRDGTHRFRDYQPQSIAFTLWWLDSDSHGQPESNRRASAEELASQHYSALRVRVQVQTHVDHVTISFFIDAAKPYGNPQIYSTKEKAHGGFGHRRRKVADLLENIREASNNQILQGYVDKARNPEGGLTADEAKKLKEAADYFYEGIWQDFKTSFDIRDAVIEDGGTDTGYEVQGERFADFRGVLMSLKGMDTPHNVERKERRDQLRQAIGAEKNPNELEQSANTGIGEFEVFDWESNEPNTILKSLWPFMRRVTPWADYREFVGCGILSWRALYLTALGATGTFSQCEEVPRRDVDIPEGHLPSEPEGEWTGNHPVRYLVVTKGEPHREQIGRFVERINAIGTKRLFALKNLPVVKNASVHLRLLGRELDGVLKEWGDKRKAIEDWYTREKLKIDQQRKKHPNGNDGGTIEVVANGIMESGVSPRLWTRKRDEQEVPSRDIQKLSDERIRRLSIIVKDTEGKLVEIGAALDNIGNGGAGRILYVVNRSNYHIEEFQRMWPTLEIGNIDGWMNYGQFVLRGLKPTFNLIKSTGERVVSLRKRLQSITDMIQTSALIVETEATRSNTEILRRIMSNLYFISIPLYYIASILVVKALSDNPLYIWIAVSIVTLIFLWTKYRTNTNVP